ncbi:DUF930 domain-containing protein [Microvirga alba]|uniref:DUF930 domain-containing protein n=1 Tax=Microvirga alba TaxID=2791025 RepID=A0A931BLB1_9HYPH|nr:DUF930 domain-containing protein [Microvirga alba]MBF9233142.1 DUF930 domain-containing protein [Microvirga alba]
MRTTLPLLEEETRMEQLCGLEAIAQIVAAFTQFQPDRVVAYAMADVKIGKNTVLAEGAAFRSHQQWYNLKFTCQLKADRQTVQAFEFLVGETIPKKLWEAHNLPAIY